MNFRFPFFLNSMDLVIQVCQDGWLSINPAMSVSGIEVP